MTSPLPIPVDDLGTWLAELKPYQRNIINEFLASQGPESAAEKWLTTTGSQNIVAFGGAQPNKPFWDRFKNQFHRFVCDETAFVEEKKALATEAPVTKALMISVISSALGAALGLSATLLAPAVVLLLYSIGRIGVAAYCDTAPPDPPADKPVQPV